MESGHSRCTRSSAFCANKHHTGDTATKIARLCARGRQSHVLGPTSNLHGACQRPDRDANSPVHGRSSWLERHGSHRDNDNNHPACQLSDRSHLSTRKALCVVETVTNIQVYTCCRNTNEPVAREVGRGSGATCHQTRQTTPTRHVHGDTRRLQYRTTIIQCARSATTIITDSVSSRKAKLS